MISCSLRATGLGDKQTLKTDISSVMNITLGETQGAMG